MQLPQQNKGFTAMNMYYSLKKFSKYIVPTMTYNGKTKHICYNSGYMVTFYTMTATFAHSDPTHLQHLQKAAVAFVYYHNNIHPIYSSDSDFNKE